MKSQQDRSIYLDSHATTRVDQDVLSTMLPYYTKYYANGSHRAGTKGNLAVEQSRLQVATLIGARPSEILFTSGATEAINLGLLGLARADTSGRKKIITQVTEHAAVLACMNQLEKEGFTVKRLGVDHLGRIDLQELCKELDKNTLLVSIMLVNNEIGTIQPIEEIGQLCRQSGALFFCDLTQGLGWYPVDVDQNFIDLAAFSAHKIYGPRGAGGLFIRRRGIHVNTDPIFFGGNQERGLRPGTMNIPAIVGMGKACEMMQLHADEIFREIRKLRDLLQDKFFHALPGVKLNGCPIERHPGNLNISIPGVSGEQLKERLPDIIFSTGSACHGASVQPSHVLSAIGLNQQQLQSAIRLGVGKYNSEIEIYDVSDLIIDMIKFLRKGSGKPKISTLNLHANTRNPKIQN